jgi:hypothetical protein
LHIHTTEKFKAMPGGFPNPKVLGRIEREVVVPEAAEGTLDLGDLRLETVK